MWIFQFQVYKNTSLRCLKTEYLIIYYSHRIRIFIIPTEKPKSNKTTSSIFYSQHRKITSNKNLPLKKNTSFI